MNTFQNKKEMLSLKGIEKSFNEIEVLKDVTLEIYENEFVSILGPSGSGKSTIFNIISGLLAPDKGNYYIEGEEFSGTLGKVSYMHQKDLLLPWKKVIDNIAIPLLIRGMDKNSARNEVKKHLQTFGLEGFENKYPFQLSGGMRQRAALLRTYMFSGKIMLLDEPFGALDAITRSKMHYWLLNVVKSLNTTVLFITHDLEEAILLSDRIYVLSDRPGYIKDEITVDLIERNKNIITTVEFNNIKKRIIQQL